MTEISISSLADLIEQITTWPVGMPVRAMEQVLAMGDGAVPALAETLVRWQDDEARDLLWPIVLLGELRDPAGIEPLINQMQRTDREPLALAAAEALAKIGASAVSALNTVTTASDPLFRLYAYASLGWIPDDHAYAVLVEALSRDRELGDVVAIALDEQGRPEAIPLLYQAYLTCDPWQRVEFENAIQDLHWHRHARRLCHKDWRLRYRRLPAWGSFEPGWAGISAVIRQNVPQLPERVTIPLRPLEEIVGDEPEPEQPPERCERCGVPITYPTGLPVCPETAVAAALHQLRLLNEDREEGPEDLFDLFDDLEEREWEHYGQGEPKTRAAKTRWRDELDDLQVCRQTYLWFIEQGTEQVGPAKALLLAKVPELVERYGDPEGLLQPARLPQSRGPKVGRNDPCPCGSGRKYKRCCLGKI
jgi:SEC-C motif-containing protein/HEAT repeat protein